jgi:hypothetical protein
VKLPAPARCFTCSIRPVAWTIPRVDYCYDCLPGGPFAPPLCRRCGSGSYYTGGLCTTCHPHGPGHVGACTGCLAWGVMKLNRWRCWQCRWWNTHYRFGICTICDRETRLSELRVCRLCWDNARQLTPAGRTPELSLNRLGQQLWFANFPGQNLRPNQHLRDVARHRPVHRSGANKPPIPPLSSIPIGQRFSPDDWEQLALFHLDPDPDAVRRRAALERDSGPLRYCDDVIRDHARVHGWTRKQIADVRRTTRLAYAATDNPTGKIKASDVLKLPAIDPFTNATATIDVLAVAGLLHDDRATGPERYFTQQTTGLPAGLTAQLRIWFDIMINGSTSPPRRRARDPETVILHIRGIIPVLLVWLAAGHETLAEITTKDVLAVLPDHPPRRHLIEQGLRSLFEVLKGRKQVFVDPMRQVPYTNTNNTIPLPLDTATIRANLTSNDPPTALAASLLAFHALTSRQLCTLKLTDIIDGRLTLGTRIFPLATPVLPRLSVWLDHRNTIWPATANPHLFISYKSAHRTTPVNVAYFLRRLNIGAQQLREDRILDEVNATGGDVRIICELFGLSVGGAMRYTTTIEPQLPQRPPRRI